MRIFEVHFHFKHLLASFNGFNHHSEWLSRNLRTCYQRWDVWQHSIQWSSCLSVPWQWFSNHLPKGVHCLEKWQDFGCQKINWLWMRIFLHLQRIQKNKSNSKQNFGSMFQRSKMLVHCLPKENFVRYKKQKINESHQLSRLMSCFFREI